MSVFVSTELIVILSRLSLPVTVTLVPPTTWTRSDVPSFNLTYGLVPLPWTSKVAVLCVVKYPGSTKATVTLSPLLVVEILLPPIICTVFPAVTAEVVEPSPIFHDP